MGLEARLLLGHCSPRLSALSGPSRIGPTDHFEGIRARHIKGQTLAEMAGTHHRSHIMENVTLTPKRTKQTSGSQQPGSRAHDLGPGSRVDGSNFPPHPPHPGGLP